MCSKDILAEVSGNLFELGEVSGRHIFIDGSKIESAANRYTFVWKKSVTKSQAKLMAKITDLISECEEMYGLKLVYKDRLSLHSLKRIRKKLYAVKEAEGITFVHGIGKRKSPVQKSIETLEAYTEKLKEYTKSLHVCGERNSYSKTDPDATDTNTLIPFLRDMEDHLGFKYTDIVADAGYESEENYLFIVTATHPFYLPVLPKPDVPRSVSSSESTCKKSAIT